MINNRNKDPKNKFRKRAEKSEYEQKVIDIARVTRVVKGGKRFSFRTVMVIGDKKGKVGIGVAKGPDMKISTEKSFADAKKNLVKINIEGNTIPYQIYKKLGSARVMLKPAAKGNGIIAGGAVRAVVGLVGINDITGKMLGSRNKLSNARATVEALEQFSIKNTREIILEKEKTEKADKEKEREIKKIKDRTKEDKEKEVKDKKTERAKKEIMKLGN